DFAAGESPVIETPDQLIDALTAGIAIETGPFAARTRARYALFIEGAGDADLLAPLLAQRAVFVAFTVNLLAAVGARSPEAAARTLMAASDGLVLHRVTIDPDAEIRPVIERAVRACLD
ncbi:MAG: TetR family transcriptional regulator, partial [Microbacterium sp.]